MPLSSTKNLHQPAKHHYRRYTWPPSLRLIDVTNIRVPLPDIDEDPFAHFVTPMAAEDEQDNYIVTAGILPIMDYSATTSEVEKAFKFRSSILKRWKSFFSKYRTKLHNRRSQSESQNSSNAAASPSQSARNVTQSSSHCGHTLTSQQRQQEHMSFSPRSSVDPNSIRPASSPMQIQRLQLAHRGGSRRRSHSHSRSWHAPTPELFTIDEKSDEDLNTKDR
jgi:hypothetical protein